jgi:predicted RNA binding protein YcfA (HicA-like mRNA interferase family)
MPNSMKFRDLVKLLQSNGWQQVRQKGSHRQFRHPQNPAVITLAGPNGTDVPPGTLNDILRKAGIR